MKRTHHFNYFNNSIKIGQKGSIPFLFTEQTIYLKRNWHEDRNPEYALRLHAKFNSDLMNGIQIQSYLDRNGKIASCIISQFRVYRVNEASWTETLIGAFTPLVSGSKFFYYLDQTTLGANELSGRETYSIECTAMRRRKKFRNKIWFNHLGCFDSINRLRQGFEELRILKLDE
jgi:hypothetical protein